MMYNVNKNNFLFFSYFQQAYVAIWTQFNHLVGEVNKVGTHTETGTLAGGHANGGGEKVKEGEGGGGDEANEHDLLNLGLLAWEEEGGGGHNETLKEIFEDTDNNFHHIKGELRHIFLYLLQRKNL